MSANDVVRPLYDERQVQDMMSEGGRVNADVDEARRRVPPGGEPELGSTVPNEGSWLRRKTEQVSEVLGRRFVLNLVRRKGRLSRSLDEVPKAMRKVANQTALVLELIDDFRDGSYREVPWHTIAIASAAVLYVVNPADLVPNFVPLVGALDDMAVVAVATRWIQKDLLEYCRWKGYPEEDYFYQPNR